MTLWIAAITEHYRHAPWVGHGGAHFWIYCGEFWKKLGFFYFLPSQEQVLTLLDGPWFKYQLSCRDFLGFIRVFYCFFALLPWLSRLGLASLVIHKLRRLWQNPAKAPKCGSSNRRTGMITVFKYKGKRQPKTSRAPSTKF